jgi:hypothetical protein
VKVSFHKNFKIVKKTEERNKRMQVLNDKVERIVSKRDKFRVSPKEIQRKSDIGMYLDAHLELKINSESMIKNFRFFNSAH